MSAGFVMNGFLRILDLVLQIILAPGWLAPLVVPPEPEHCGRKRQVKPIDQAAGH